MSAQKKHFDLKNFRYSIAIIALIGFAIMIYLTVIHFTQARSFCDLSETVSCDVVTTSLYSEVFGIPVSILGILFFAWALFWVLWSKNKNDFQPLTFATLFVLLPSLYLTLTEILFIKSFCVLCETSKVLMVLILILAIVGQKKSGQPIVLRMLVPVVIAGLVASGVVYFAQAGTSVAQDYSGLVSCLNDHNVVYYKSVRCTNCKRQEKLLGPAYQELNSVECHPDGENPNPELCFAKNISHTPTFLIEEDGQEVGRVVGLQKIEDLAKFGNCEVN